MYPPGAIWGAAALGEVTDASTLDLLRWLPLLLSIAGMAAFAWLAWRVLPPMAAVGATFAYALMPHAYDWVIAGGGLTRSLGLLAALVAMAIAAERPPPRVGRLPWQASRWESPSCRIRRRRSSESSVASFSPGVHRMAPWARNAAVAGAVALVVTLPWLVGVLATHGADALASPANRLQPLTGLIRLGNLRFSGAPFMDVFAVVGAVGVLVAVLRWSAEECALLLLLTYLAGAGGGAFLAAVPWALACGIGLEAIVRVAVPNERTSTRRALVAGAAAVVLFLALIGSLGSVADGSSKLHALNADHLDAMAWLAANTDEEASVLVPVRRRVGRRRDERVAPGAGPSARASGPSRAASGSASDGFESQLATPQRDPRLCGLDRRVLCRGRSGRRCSSSRRASSAGRFRRATVARPSARPPSAVAIT